MIADLYPGLVVLFGSGETSPAGKKIFDHALEQIIAAGRLSGAPRVALLETPAGFELNSPQVIQRVADFLQVRLQNYRPITTVVPARKKGTAYSPDDPEITQPLLKADMIFMGPGSPSYAVRQLQGSLAWQRVVASHRLGATLALASAATVAVSSYCLPVYEIYKVGEDLHWKKGLNLFAPFGASLVFIPHWNNQDGGEELDTSRCFMGKSRFDQLLEMLPPGNTVVGIDEKSALVFDFRTGLAHVLGLGDVTVIMGPTDSAQKSKVFQRGQHFDLGEIGEFQLPEGPVDIAPEIWQETLKVRSERGKLDPAVPPQPVHDLVAQREAARLRKDWQQADEIRAEIQKLGWNIKDTPDGPVLEEAGG